MLNGHKLIVRICGKHAAKPYLQILITLCLSRQRVERGANKLVRTIRDSPNLISALAASVSGRVCKGRDVTADLLWVRIALLELNPFGLIWIPNELIDEIHGLVLRHDRSFSRTLISR